MTKAILAFLLQPSANPKLLVWQRSLGFAATSVSHCPVLCNLLNEGLLNCCARCVPLQLGN